MVGLGEEHHSERLCSPRAVPREAPKPRSGVDLGLRPLGCLGGAGGDVLELAEVALGVEGGRAAGAGRGDRLAVVVVDLTLQAVLKTTSET